MIILGFYALSVIVSYLLLKKALENDKDLYDIIGILVIMTFIPIANIIYASLFFMDSSKKLGQTFFNIKNEN